MFGFRFLDMRPFLDPDSIKLVIKDDPEFNPEVENLEESQALMIFGTSSQQTWLIFTNARLYCVLDDREKASPVLKWSIPIRDAATIPITVEPYSEESGQVNIGNHSGWLFSKRLFEHHDISDLIKQYARAQHKV